MEHRAVVDIILHGLAQLFQSYDIVMDIYTYYLHTFLSFDFDPPFTLYTAAHTLTKWRVLGDTHTAGDLPKGFPWRTQEKKKAAHWFKDTKEISCISQSPCLCSLCLTIQYMLTIPWLYCVHQFYFIFSQSCGSYVFVRGFLYLTADLCFTLNSLKFVWLVFDVRFSFR